MVRGVMQMTPDIATKWASRLLSILRIVTALLFLQHGMQKMFGFPVPPPSGLPALFTLGWYAGAIELVGGVLVLLGLFARPAAFIMSGEMAFAYWIAHAPRSPFPIVNGGDSAVLYCFVFLYIAIAGPGAWAVGAWAVDRARGRAIA